MAVIEFARNVAGLTGANSEEVSTSTKHPVIHIMHDQKKLLASKKYGGTIRLGNWPCKIIKDSVLAKSYKHTKTIQERHRHRFEFNNTYRRRLEAKGLVISGQSPDGNLVEAIEIKNHPFFVGTQFHPEYKSSPLEPHPLFIGFVKASIKIKAVSSKRPKN
ncbi:gamma-glutamyl-gamma-aminobutyrate hydrolase family protein, partial [Patescibacteria group bacterium]